MASKQFSQSPTDSKLFSNAQGFTISYGGEDGEYWGLWLLRYPDNTVIDTDIYSVDLAKRNGIELIYL